MSYELSLIHEIRHTYARRLSQLLPRKLTTLMHFESYRTHQQPDQEIERADADPSLQIYADATHILHRETVKVMER